MVWRSIGVVVWVDDDGGSAAKEGDDLSRSSPSQGRSGSEPANQNKIKKMKNKEGAVGDAEHREEEGRFVIDEKWIEDRGSKSQSESGKRLIRSKSDWGVILDWVATQYKSPVTRILR
ncbi:hypothetical protein Scep_002155 [Stephania cephalantha]|uniref:Uncharacterized protein n=1 Tax=Stephania cephalantha TaxID=152367 RepID=A0AAP0LDE4_9MAGN